MIKKIKNASPFPYKAVVLALLLVTGVCRAQDTSAIVLKNVRLLPKSSADSKKKTYYVAMDMTHPEKASKAHFLIGKSKSGSDLVHKVGKFKHSGKGTSLDMDGKEESPCGQTIGMLVDIPNGFFKDLHSVTVYIEDAKGNLSNRIQFESFD